MIERDPLVVLLKADDGQFLDVTRRAAEGLDRIGASAGSMVRDLGKSREATKLSRQEMMALNYTVSDIAASLASGASPFTILLQQGGQVKDAFGGVGNLFRGLASLITPASVAIGGLALGIGGAVTAFVQGRKEASEFEKSLIVTGNAAGVTADQLGNMAQRVAEGSRQTIGEARSIVRELVATGQVPAGVISSSARAIAQLADATGQDAKKIVADFAGMSSGVAKWAAEHNKAWNFITVEQFKYIQRLEQQGRAEQAAAFVNERLVQHLSRQSESLGYIERALDFGAKAWSRFWNAAMNMGRPETVGDRLADANKQLAALQAQLDRNVKIGRGEAVIPGLGSLNDGLRRQIRDAQSNVLVLMRQLDEANLSALGQADSAARNRTGIDKLLGGGGKKADIPSAIRDAREAYKAAFLASEKEAYGVIARTEKEQREAFERSAAEAERFMMAAVQASDERVLRMTERQREEGARLVQDLSTQTDSIFAGMIRNAEGRGRALLAIERAQLTSRLDVLRLEGETRRQAEDAIAGYMVAREAQLTEELKPEWQRRLEAWNDTTELMRQAHESLMSGIIDQGEQAFTQWLRTGQLTTRTLVNYIGDEFAKLAYRKYIAGGLAGLLDIGLSALLGGGDIGIGATRTDGLVGLPTRGGAATGTNFVQRDMLTILHKGEAVIPKAYNPSAGGRGASERPVVLNVTYNVPDGQSPASYAAALEQHTQRVKAEVAADMARPGRLLQRAVVAAL